MDLLGNLLQILPGAGGIASQLTSIVGSNPQAGGVQPATGNPFFSLLNSGLVEGQNVSTFTQGKDGKDTQATDLLGILQSNGLLAPAAPIQTSENDNSGLVNAAETLLDTGNASATAISTIQEIIAGADENNGANPVEIVADKNPNIGTQVGKSEDFDQPIQSIISKVPNNTNLNDAGEPLPVGNSAEQLRKDESANAITFSIDSGKAIAIAKASEHAADVAAVKDNKLAAIARNIEGGQVNKLAADQFGSDGKNNNPNSGNPNNAGINGLLASANDNPVSQAAQGTTEDFTIKTDHITHPLDSKTSELAKTTHTITNDNALRTHNNAAEQVHLKVMNAVKNGESKINIQLEPANLGKVEVSIDTNSDGKVSVVVMADKSDTLDLLQKDARALERALQNAGIKADANSLSFNLRGGEGQNLFKNFEGQTRAYSGVNSGNNTAEELLAISGNSKGAAYLSDRLLDIRV